MPHNQDTNSPESDALLDRFVAKYDDYEAATVERRARAEKRRDYYDGIQWTSGDAATLNTRNQPVVTSNRVAPKINSLLGSEVRNRYDPHAFPRTPDHDDDASVVTDALRYVADAEDINQRFSQGAEDLLIEGMCGVLLEPEFMPGSEEVTIRARPLYWNRIFYDPYSRSSDFSDATYTGIVVWRDYEDAVDDPQYDDEARAVLELSKLGSGGDSDDAHRDIPDSRYGTWFTNEGGRDRVKIVELYYLDSVKDSDGEPIDDGELGWHVVTYTRKGMLQPPRLVELRDDNNQTFNPMLLASGYVNRHGERYGPVEMWMSAQDEINKRRSKALHLLSLRQMVAEDGAFPDPTEAKVEFSKPDGWITVAAKAIRDGRFQIQQTADMTDGQFKLLADAYAQIDATGPQTMLPTDGGKISGRAFIAQQEQSALEFEPLFDNLRDWRLRVYRAIWFMIRQFWTYEKWFRVRDDEDRKGYKFVGLNRRMTTGQRYHELVENDMEIAQAVDQSMGKEGTQALQEILQQVQIEAQQIAEQTGQQVPPEQLEQAAVDTLLATPIAQQPFLASSVASLDMDIVLDATRHSAVIEHEEFQDLLALQQSGQLGLPAEAILKASSLRNKDQLISMVQAPPADPAAQQLEQETIQTQLALLKATVEKLSADAALSAASAQRAEAQAAKAAAEAQAVPAEAQKDQAQGIKYAAEAGAITGTKPQLADHLGATEGPP